LDVRSQYSSMSEPSKREMRSTGSRALLLPDGEEIAA
jgi:hypothetical protein